MSTGLIVHLVLCALGTAAGALLAMASIISIANMKVPWVGALLIAAMVLPFVWLGSGIAAWLLNNPNGVPWFKTLVIVPWTYTVTFIGAMWMSFEQ